MRQTFKKLFFRFSEKIALVFLGFVILVILLSPQSALAGFWDWIVGGITYLPNLAIIIILQVAILTWSSFATLAGVILKWVLSPGFTHWSYTGLDNPVIEIGLGITQGFVNMALVLVLIYIAFATILRLGGAQTQKLLVTLIIVALLVNFAPVICGLIVDASNIAMHYFTDHITGMENLTNTIGAIGDRLKEAFTTLKATEQFGTIVESGVLIIFNMVLTFILLLFAFLFMLRYIAIWTAVILAPLAFVAYILPATRRFFTLWWNQFIQWCLIGVVAGFFFYLAEQLSSALSDMNVPETEYGVFDAILPHFVTLAFLALGLIMALTTSAMGASQIITLGKKGGTWAGKQAGKFAAGTVRGVPAVTKAESAARRRLERVPVLGRAIGGAGAYGTELAAAKKREGMKLEPMGSGDEIRAAIRARPITREDRLKRARGLEILGERGWLKDTPEEKKWFLESQAYGIQNSKVLDAMPHWAPDVGKNIRAHVQGMKADEFWQRVKPDALSNLEVFYGMDQSKVRRLGERGELAQKMALRNTIVKEQAKIQAEINQLRGAGQAQEANRLRDMANYIWTNPNYL
jgi:hypothetical protein